MTLTIYIRYETFLGLCRENMRRKKICSFFRNVFVYYTLPVKEKRNQFFISLM